MSDVVNEVKEEVQKVAEEVKQFFVYEKEHIQAFLDYLAKRPYAEVMEIIEVMEQGRAFNAVPTPAPVAPVETTTEPTVAPTDATTSPLETPGGYNELSKV